MTVYFISFYINVRAIDVTSHIFSFASKSKNYLVAMALSAFNKKKILFLNTLLFSWKGD